MRLTSAAAPVKRAVFLSYHRGSIRETIRVFSADKNADVDHLIETSLDKTSRRRIPENQSSNRITTTRLEALSLYREIMRITALFDWPHPQSGELWRDILRQSAREEFEQAKHERDPETVNRLLVVGRDAVHQVAEKFLEKRAEIHNKYTNDHTKGKT